MNILMISPAFPPRTGGLETYVSSLAAELCRRGHRIVVLTNRDTLAQPEQERVEGVEVVRASGLLRGKGHANYVPWERAYFSLLNDIAERIDPATFDVLHCHTQVALLLAHLSGLARAIPTVASFHETNPHRDPLGEQRTRFVVQSCPAAVYLVGSDYFARQACALGVPAERIRRVHMGVAPRGCTPRDAARQRLHAAFGIEPAKTMISLVGRFIERKQHRRLLAAHAAMEHREDVVVVLAGSRNSIDERYLRRLRAEVGAPARHGVHLLEDLSDTWRNLVVDGTDIGTQPSSAEGLGLAVIELMMAGVPVLVSDIPGLREAVVADPASLVRTEEPVLYSAELDRLAADPALRARRGAAMSALALAHFSIERAAVLTLAVYSDLAGAS